MPSRSCGLRAPFAVAALFAALLAGCDGSDAEVGPSSDDRGLALSGIDPDRQPPAAPVEGAVDGGLVTVSSESGISTLDPTEAWYYESMSILPGLVTRTLTQYVYDPELRSMVLIPDIATDIGTPNDDFTEWTYTIRDGVTFEDGTEVTADDVAYGIMRSFDRETFSDGPTTSNDFFLGGDVYQGPYRSGTDYDGIVVDGDTVTLKMARPFPDMPHWAAFPAITPIPEDDSDPDEYRLHPLATGPYKVAEFTPNKSLTLVRNEHWDPETDPGRHAYPDEYRFTFGQPSKPVEPAILAGTATGQTTIRFNGVAQRNAQTAVSETPDLATVRDIPCTLYLAIDMRKITDVRVRKAIGYAYPYQAIVEARGQIEGLTSAPGRTLLLPAFPGRVDYNPLPPTRPGETDPAQAKALLKEAGYRPGEYTIKLAYHPQDPSFVAASEALIEGLEAGGFAVRADVVDTFDTWSQRRLDPNSPYNIRQGGWCPDWPTGSNWFVRPFTTDNPAYNMSYFDEPAVTAEIERIAALPLDQQPAEWGALDETIATEHYPLVVTEYPREIMLHGSRIGGMNNDDVRAMPTWKDIHVLSD